MNHTKGDPNVQNSKERKAQSARKLSNQSPDTYSSSKRVGTSPGPAAYKIKSIFENKSGFSIPSSRPYQKVGQKPDPWTYIPQDVNIKAKSPQATIGKQTRIQKQRDGPSPAHYLTNYNVLFHSIRRPVFGTERRVISQQNFGPGPANYDYLKSDAYRTYQRFVKIGRDRRDHGSKQKEAIPGPNKYQPESDIDAGIKKKKGFSIGQRLKCKTETDSPQDYLRQQAVSNNDKEVVMKKTPAYTFKKQVRNQVPEVASPGPAAYFPADHQDKGPVIGKSLRRLHSVTTFPGPQAYVAIPQLLSPSFSIPRADMKDHFKVRTPGPGNYSPQLPESQKYRSIGIGERPSPAKQSNLPGPGQYNIVVRSTKGFSIGREEKLQNFEQRSPGPAHYFLESSLGKSKSNRRL